MIFLSALMFLTRLPVPKHMDHNESLLQQTPKYFPLVGWIVGMLSFTGFIVLYKFTGTNIAILASVITGIFTTGAFHEDGFADTCDAFGGGWTKEKILAIMKDSRLGTYGVAGLVLMLAAKFLLLKELVEAVELFSFTKQDGWILYRAIAIVIITAHSISRLMPVLVIQQYKYVTSDDGSKSKPLASKKLTVTALIVAIVFALLPLFFLSWLYLMSVIPILVVVFFMARYFKKWIGGYTGDCLGAIQQVSEIIFYLSLLMIWKFI